MTIYELSIVIPCYNEDKNIYPLFEKIKKLLKDNNFTEIIIVDNGSTDNTYENAMSSNLYKENKINILKIEKNIGYGHGIMSGVNIAKGQCIGWCHADLQTEPTDVLNAYIENKEELMNKKCIIKGLRKNRNFFDAIFTFGMSLFASFIFQKKINDINAQPKLFLRSFLSYIKDYPLDFSLDLYLLVIAKKNNYRIINHEVIMKKRLFGEAKGGGNFIGKLKLIKRTFTYIIELRRKLWNL
jgi:glycosyltransferase involved in cell wall biosynthesis